MIAMDARTVAELICSGEPLPKTTIVLAEAVELHPADCSGQHRT